MSNPRLAGKVTLVTGAAGGIGEAIVRRLAAEGAILIVADIAEAAGTALAASVDGTFLKLDVTDEDQWRAAISRIEADHGRLDGLVNNAGINRSAGGETPDDVLMSDLRTMMAINLEGVALGCKHALAAMARNGGGSIVNMSSTAGLLPSDFIVAYGATKAAVAHWTKSTALHCGRRKLGVRCNSVHPGVVLTPMMDELFERMATAGGITPAEADEALRARFPLGTYQTPDDIANAVLFLLSDEARAITGIELVVDGGLMLAN